MSNPLITELERRFLSKFRAVVDELRREFPSIRITTFSHSVGSATSYQGHSVGIACLFLHAPPDHADNIALSIDVMHLTSEPKLNEASVCWGAGAGPGGLEADLIDSPIPFSTAALDQVEAELPVLYRALSSALRDPPFPHAAA